MYVFDEATQKWTEYGKCCRILIENTSNLLIYGYTSKPERIVKALIKTKHSTAYYEIDPKLYKGKLLFSKRKGVYFSPINFDKKFIELEQLIKGNGDFPYILHKKYEAIESFDLFKDRQIIKDNSTLYQISKYLKYTFGLEFETSNGYIPEDICYRDGLIPLRDGSITAPEYSTVVLNGNDGISLLHQQIETLKEYTIFNKDCSLHIHFGNYPLDKDKIFNLYKVCKNIESDLKYILPEYTFKTSLYKSNGKDYCKLLGFYNNFDEMYYNLVKEPFYGSLVQPHPFDLYRSKKWCIPTRKMVAWLIGNNLKN